MSRAMMDGDALKICEYNSVFDWQLEHSIEEKRFYFAMLPHLPGYE